jgi:hypothetical protein
MKTHFLFPVTLFFKNRAIDEIMWKNIVEPDRSQMTDSMESAHGMLETKGYKHTLLECVILIAFLLQQWLHKCTSVT